MGITVQSANVIVEPIAPVTQNGNVLIEPGTPLTPVAPLTPTTPTAGFTIVTLPSQIEGTTVSASNQVTGAVVVTAARPEDGSLSALIP